MISEIAEVNLRYQIIYHYELARVRAGCHHVCLKSPRSSFKGIHKQKKAAVLASKQYLSGKTPYERSVSTKQQACESLLQCHVLSFHSGREHNASISRS